MGPSHLRLGGPAQKLYRDRRAQAQRVHRCTAAEPLATRLHGEMAHGNHGVGRWRLEIAWLWKLLGGCMRLLGKCGKSSDGLCNVVMSNNGCLLLNSGWLYLGLLADDQ